MADRVSLTTDEARVIADRDSVITNISSALQAECVFDESDRAQVRDCIDQMRRAPEGNLHETMKLSGALDNILNHPDYIGEIQDAESIYRNLMRLTLIDYSRQVEIAENRAKYCEANHADGYIHRAIGERHAAASIGSSSIDVWIRLCEGCDSQFTETLLEPSLYFRRKG